MNPLADHSLTGSVEFKEILFERRALLSPERKNIDGLYNTWISFNNPKQLNSYTTKAIKEVILAFRQASCDRSTVAVVFSGVGDKAFCTGGNTKEYAEYYAGNPQEYKQYMRLFNDMVTSILTCDKPVINRVNGMRIGGGQEIGMACDISIASDMARFGQAGPKHGSAPDGGSTDFLHLFIGIERAMYSCTLCEPFTAQRAVKWGPIHKIVPVLKNRNGDFISNPLVNQTELDSWGNPACGTMETGSEKEKAVKIMSECTVDFSLLDNEVEKLCWSFAHTMPDCLSKTAESLRKKKLEHWQKNCETNRSWLALNMMTEGKAGFKAFNEGPKNNREVDFLKLRRALAEGTPWTDSLLSDILPK